MVLVQVTEPQTGKLLEYYMDGKLKREVDTKLMPILHKQDEDAVYVVDGSERAGKSVFTMGLAKYVDPSFCIERICFSPDEFRKAILKAEKGQVVVFDEAYRGLSSKGSLTEINRILEGLMMEMGQKNLCVFILLPTFFLLQKYVALFRAKGVFHVFKYKGRKGFWRYYNSQKKKLLFLKGKKDYSYGYVKSGFKGRFYNFYPIDVVAYRLQKSISLKKGYKSTKAETYMAQRNICIYTLYQQGLTQQLIADELKKNGLKMNRANISLIISQMEKEKDY